MPDDKSKYFLSGVSSAVIWGFFAFPLRNLKTYSAEQILYFRVFCALAITWLIIFIFRKAQLSADIRVLKTMPAKERKTIFYQIVISATLLMFNWFTFIYAINHVSIKSAAFAYMVCPLITAFGGYWLLKEQLSRLQFIALFLATISILFLAKGSLIDVLWSVLIAALYAFFLIFQRKMTGLDKLNVMATQIGIACVFMIPLFFYTQVKLPTETYFWANILIIASLFTVIPLFLNIYALVGIPSSTMGIIIYINPLIAFIIAFVYFNEKVNTNQILSYGLLLTAVFLFNWKLLKDMLIFKRK